MNHGLPNIFELTENENTAYENLWEEASVFLRRKFIASKACAKKEKSLNNFSFQLKKIKKKWKITPLFNPMNCSPPGSSLQGILQARILEWAAMPSSRGSSWPRDLTHGLLGLLHWQVGSLPQHHLGSPFSHLGNIKGTVIKEYACQWRRHGFDPWIRKISFSMDREAWQAAAHGVTKSWTQLSMSVHVTYAN